MFMFIQGEGPIPLPLRMSLAGNDVVVSGTCVRVRGTVDVDCAGAGVDEGMLAVRVLAGPAVTGAVLLGAAINRAVSAASVVVGLEPDNRSAFHVARNSSTCLSSSGSRGASWSSAWRTSIVRTVQMSREGSLASPRAIWASMILLRTLGSKLISSSLLKSSCLTAFGG